jgi:two-component system, sensor histidine kinase PdtaS
MTDPSARDSSLSLISRLPAWPHSPVCAYAFGLAAFALGLLVRYQLNGALPVGFPFISFFPAIVFTAFVAGLGPAMLVTTLSMLAAWYLFVPPVYSFALTPDGAIALALFVITAAIVVTVIHVMHTALARLRDEREKSARLAEQRELLFAELQHRISNNLQVVSALMTLQQSSLSDAQARQALSEASHRLGLIAKLNRKLHDPANAGLDLKEFLRELCQDVSRAAGIEDAGCNIKGLEGVSLPADKAVPLALIVTELLNNSIEHGFAGRSVGELHMDLTRSSADEIVLTVQDNGHGLPPAFDIKQAKSLGLRIVQSLAQQIGARLEFFSDKGTTCRLTFAP